MRVEFGGMIGERKKIGEAESIDGCWKIINQFLNEHNYKSYYQRISEEEDGSLWIDFGSHTRFFWIIDGDNHLKLTDIGG